MIFSITKGSTFHLNNKKNKRYRDFKVAVTCRCTHNFESHEQVGKTRAHVKKTRILRVSYFNCFEILLPDTYCSLTNFQSLSEIISLSVNVLVVGDQRLKSSCRKEVSLSMSSVPKLLSKIGCEFCERGLKFWITSYRLLLM